MLTTTPYVRKDHHPLPMGTQGGMLRRLMVEDRGGPNIVRSACDSGRLDDPQTLDFISEVGRVLYPNASITN